MLRTTINIILKREELLLRVAVAFPMLWAGVRQILNPTDWIGFVPTWVASVIEPEAFLVAHAFFNLITGLGLLLGFWRILFSLAAVASLTGILVFYGIDDITFRDVGLAIIAFVIFVRSLKRHFQYK